MINASILNLPTPPCQVYQHPGVRHADTRVLANQQQAKSKEARGERKKRNTIVMIKGAVASCSRMALSNTLCKRWAVPHTCLNNQKTLSLTSYRQQ